MNYAEKRARRIGAAIDLAIRVTDGEPPPAPARRPRTPPPEKRGTLVDLGTMPQNCADCYQRAAQELDRAAAIAREMLAHTHRSCQSGEATSAALLAETTAPRLRAAAVRLSRMPTAPRPSDR